MSLFAKNHFIRPGQRRRSCKAPIDVVEVLDRETRLARRYEPKTMLIVKYMQVIFEGLIKNLFVLVYMACNTYTNNFLILQTTKIIAS